MSGRKRGNRRRDGANGVTLMELLIAVILTGAVVLLLVDINAARTRIKHTQQSMDTVQQQAHQALYHLTKSIYHAYAVNQPPSGRFHVQQIRPGLDVAYPDELEQPSTFQCNAYEWDVTTGQLLFIENIGLNGQPLAGQRRTVLATNVANWTVIPATNGANLFTITLVTNDPRANRQYTLGPAQITSRVLTANPPPGWPRVTCQ